MILSKTKKAFLLVLLLGVSLALGAMRLISGGWKTPKAEAQSCWTLPGSGWSCSTGGYPDACATTTSGGESSSDTSGCSSAADSAL